MRKHRHQKMLLVWLASLLVTLLVGCGNSRPEPEDVIASARDASGEVSAYRIEMTVINTENGETTRSSALMEYVLPDRLHTVTIYEGESEESIRIGQTEYRRDAGGDSWRVRQWPESFPFPDLSAVWVEELGSLVGLVELEDEEIDGVDCYHYRGSVDMKAKGEEEKAMLDPTQPDYEERMRALEVYDQWQLQSEFWIGKEDYLLRQLEQHQEMYLTEDPGEDTEKEESYIITATCRFFDFNQPIQIELPVADMVEGVNLTASSTSSVGGKDLQHQQIKYEITVSNKGIETAREVRVFVKSPATNQGLQTMEADPAQKPVALGPDEHETYFVSWEYDLTKSSKEELVKLLKENVLRATWIDENSQQHEKVLLEGG